MADLKSSSKSSSYRSQKATVADLSLGEKLDVVPAIISTVNSYLSIPTDDTYAKVCKRRGQPPSSEVLEDGTKAHWIGKKRAEKLVINFHGGGYVLPASDQMFEFMFQVVEGLNSKGKDAACLFLAYDLAPGAIYPRQLQQAAALLTHVLHTLHYPPSSILITGDSAGANLCMALLSHISYPHPSTELRIQKVELGGEKLLGVVLISPWISFETANQSFGENEWKDCVSTQAGTSWSSAFLACPWPHAGHKDAYNEALSAPPSWWTHLPVSSMLVMCGSEEVLRDGIVKFEANLRDGLALASKDSERGEAGQNGKGGTELDFHVVKGEYHDQPNVDLHLGYKERDEGQTARIVKSWLGSKL
ncbi:hypothetical protein B2J93_6488 [Marssonina coronariae]|uniref:Alpha/beta hydrolase fold-3 domain-containing protein n=1 Tax=Diplocarpon coronariae TaxID=2795749 RepID=A0A218Z5X7_9HELO|nr:hypothetical protein B2J93_6488 [Marssonina coronariae]